MLSAIDAVAAGCGPYQETISVAIAFNYAANFASVMRWVLLVLLEWPEFLLLRLMRDIVLRVWKTCPLLTLG